MTRADELDQMTDLQAIASLEAEFPRWMVFRGVSGLCEARWHDRPGVSVCGEDWADLRDQVIREVDEGEKP